MQYEKAVIRYFNCNPRNHTVLRRLVRWDERATLAENVKRAHLANENYARKFVEHFKLKYSDRRFNKTRAPKINPQALEKLSKWGYTYQQIGELHGVSRQRIEQIIRKWRNGKGGNHA